MPKKIGVILWFWTPVVLWMGIIFYASSITASEMPRFDLPNIDKLFHSIEYLILGFLLARAFIHSSFRPNYRYIFIAAFLIASLSGASDEFHQRFVQGRSCDLFDLLFDIIGAGLGAGLSVYKESLPAGRQG